MKHEIDIRKDQNLDKYEIVVENFHKKFKDINIGPFSFKIEKGKVNAILGSSGSGKSVFINSLLGATLSYKGTIYINGKDRKKYNSIEINSKIGFYTQMDFSLYPISAYAFLTNICNVMGINANLANDRIEFWLKKFDLWTSKDKALKDFSWGMKNRMNLIICFIKEPQIMILDEPGSNLDSNWRSKTYDIMNEFNATTNCTIILVVHNINEVYDNIDNFIILEKGQLLFSGTKKELGLYKKIKVFFETNSDLDLVEKTLNEHDILTFEPNSTENSIIVGLKKNQSFDDLSILNSVNIKVKTVISQQINIDEIKKTLKDKERPHIPKYLPLSNLNVGANVKNNKAIKAANDDKYLSSQKETEMQHFEEIEYDKLLTQIFDEENDLETLIQLSNSLQNDDMDIEDMDIDTILLQQEEAKSIKKMKTKQKIKDIKEIKTKNKTESKAMNKKTTPKDNDVVEVAKKAKTSKTTDIQKTLTVPNIQQEQKDNKVAKINKIKTEQINNNDESQIIQNRIEEMKNRLNKTLPKSK
ncbi:ATP-binding cassette domain-containing protein [Williamsoniiplasma luminosum]|uniref:ABC transporter ATP-binding protein n=1 Tax=Williamsoniiplasma luminosum TaxID=214888 RepID=A0A2S0NJL6_9MOLU|nr:ABC transporter ATP-binding protein [Williamsoniiplasma luminosum]AVP49197.1 MAG: ABC transporter ATP-binding protein [Williamsoniiplasma luminosum]